MHRSNYWQTKLAPKKLQQRDQSASHGTECCDSELDVNYVRVPSCHHVTQYVQIVAARANCTADFL
jgi:hypothetical protein